MLVLFYINLLAAEAHRILNERGGQIESKLFALSVVLLMIVPLFIALAFPLITAIRFNTSLYFEIWTVISRVPAWTYVFFTVPCSLTLMASWKAKDRCYRELCARDSLRSR